MNDYEGFIKKVFSTGGDKSFPFVPYVIMNNNRDLSNSAEAISLLYNILISDEFTRNDFYKLITNPSIQKSRGIDNNKVNDIIESLDKMNVYRNHKKCDEWLYGIKRLLLSKLIGNSYNDNYINLNGDIYLPYGNIAMDDNTISVICDIVNDILEFRKNNDFSVDNIKILLDKWLSYSKNQEFEENYYYNSSLRILDFIKENNLELPKEIIFKALINSSKNITITPANIITGGVTFLDFNPKNVISSKYIFLLGMSDNNLPRIDCNDELDERLVRKSITTIDYETYNFICNNATKLYMSYVNIDLKSLQKFMPSLLLSKNTPDLILGLSEDRDYSSLYSKSEFNKKSYGINLTKNFNSIEKSYSLLELPKIVKYRELADFINEGLQAKIKRLITKNDNSLEKSSKEYEPLKSSIDYKLKNDLILKMLEERTNELDEEIIDEIFDRYKITHDIPYLENDIDDSIKVCKNYFMTIIEGYNLCKPFTLDLNYNDFNWTLDIKDSFIFSFNDGKYYFYNLYPNTYKKPSDYTKIYIISLAYIVKENISNAIIRLNNNKEFEVSLNTAIYLLNELYNKYNDYSLCYFSPINSYSLNNDQYDDVIKNSKTEWRNFNDSNMVKIRDIAGYNRKSFKDFWDKYKKEVNNLVLYNIEEDNND